METFLPSCATVSSPSCSSLRCAVGDTRAAPRPRDPRRPRRRPHRGRRRTPRRDGERCFSLPPERGLSPAHPPRARSHRASRFRPRRRPGYRPARLAPRPGTPAPRRLPPSDPALTLPLPTPRPTADPSSSERPLFAIRAASGSASARLVRRTRRSFRRELHGDSRGRPRGGVGRLRRGVPWFPPEPRDGEGQGGSFPRVSDCRRVLNSLGADAEISDDLYERMEAVMLERLATRCPGSGPRPPGRYRAPGRRPGRQLRGRRHHALVREAPRRGEEQGRAESHPRVARHLRLHHPARRGADPGRVRGRPPRRVPGAREQVPVDAISIALRATAASRAERARPSVRAAAVECSSVGTRRSRATSWPFSRRWTWRRTRRWARWSSASSSRAVMKPKEISA